MSKENGFTLLEITICLLIIGLITAISLPKINQQVDAQNLQKEAAKLIADIEKEKIKNQQNGSTSHIEIKEDGYYTDEKKIKWANGITTEKTQRILISNEPVEPKYKVHLKNKKEKIEINFNGVEFEINK